MIKIYFFIICFCVCCVVNAQIITNIDFNFKSVLLTSTIDNGIATNSSGFYIKIDANSDGEIDLTEALEVYELNVSYKGLTSLVGIENFINIQKLDCDVNNLSTLDLTLLSNLEVLECQINQINYLNIDGLMNLRIIEASSNLITSLNVSGLISLEELSCSSNLINTLVLDNSLVNLTSLNINYNNLTSLNLGNLPNLNFVSCHNNSLTELNFNQCTNIIGFSCNNNQLTTLNLNNLTNLNYFQCSYNYGLQTIFLKNGKTYTSSNSINLLGCSELNYICVDEQNIQVLKDKLAAVGNTDCEVNSYCSFTPGGEFSVVNGIAKLDMDENGCNPDDTFYSNLNLNIFNGSNSFLKTSDAYGNYSIPLTNGSYTITPILENPTYFNLSPASFSVTFPGVSPYLQNFCITPSGVHNDLEATILPLDPARPGFNATYKVVCKNKGTTTLSGSITFEFEDDKMDVISSIPIFSSQSTGLLTYDYTNLQPLETREILLTLNINSPQESPAVNIGDQLNFTVIINPISGDEFLFDNTSSLKQTVVGSYDPNDKTCIEGNIVGLEMIGQYVHYLIRFENTGTFPAENVVVKDMIDLTKFDLSTLIPTSSSHSFVTRIAADGKVEFIFENIQLPFDDANNDGYVAFKIKTLPSLAIGDTFSNNANIYFDYNFPIETNTATTAIQVLGNSDFNLSDYMTLYPNPVKNELNIKVNNIISITSINVYNSLGQLVLVATNPSESIDVSSLKSGNYFIKMISDKGITTTKFIKE